MSAYNENDAGQQGDAASCPIGPFRREWATDYGRWDRMYANGKSVPFNSSHCYPLHPMEYIENVKRLVRGEEPRILYVELRPTNLCNHNCRDCFSLAARERSNATISATRLSTLIDEFHRLDVGVVRFAGGGEPLLLPGIEGYVETLTRYGIGTAVITNGALLGRKNIHKLAACLNLLRVSLNGGPHTHSLIHNTSKAAFRNIARAIERMARLRDAIGRQRSLYIAVTYLVYPDNVSEISTTAQRLMSIGVDGVYFRAPNGHQQFAEDTLSQLRQQSLAAACLSDDRFFVHFAARLFDAGAHPNRNRSYCYAAQFRIYIEATGQVTGCGRWSGGVAHQFGNIYERTLRDILDGNPALQCLRSNAETACDECDSVYLNQAMDFVKDHYLRDSECEFTFGRGE